MERRRRSRHTGDVEAELPEAQIFYASIDAREAVQQQILGGESVSAESSRRRVDEALSQHRNLRREDLKSWLQREGTA